MKNSNTNTPQKTGATPDKKKVSNVARDDGVEPPKSPTTQTIKPSVDPNQTKKV